MLKFLDLKKIKKIIHFFRLYTVLYRRGKHYAMKCLKKLLKNETTPTNISGLAPSPEDGRLCSRLLMLSSICVPFDF